MPRDQAFPPFQLRHHRLQVPGRLAAVLRLGTLMTAEPALREAQADHESQGIEEPTEGQRSARASSPGIRAYHGLALPCDMRRGSSKAGARIATMRPVSLVSSPPGANGP